VLCLLYLAIGFGTAVTTWFANEELYHHTHDKLYEHVAFGYLIALFFWPVIWAFWAHDVYADRRFQVEETDTDGDEVILPANILPGDEITIKNESGKLIKVRR
jgi:hypothetical protein